MAEITTLTALFTADLSQFEIGVGKATALMNGSAGRINADLGGIASASVGMSNTVVGSLNGISIALQKVMADVMALKSALNSLDAGAVKNTGKGGGGGNSIQGGTFVFNGVQDVNGLYDELERVSQQRSAG
ncbi:MAG: hypothetical protein MUE54_13020, partial [Anaerolineae bacterium]|jgi:hypothetical protein|nr:hypothetical protein [Anaerolineae bacterium]